MSAPVTHVPPQNIEAEESVLGAMLVSEPALATIIGEVELRASDFFFDKHAILYSAVRDLYEAGQPTDELAVADVLNQRGQMEAVGGRHYVSEVAAKVPAAGNAKHYAEIIRRDARRRRLIGAGQRIQEAGQNGHGTAELIELVRGELDKLDGVAGAAKEDAAASLPWRWGEELTDAAPEEPEWIFEGYISPGSKTIVAGLAKAGKTTLIAALIEAIASDASSFLGRAISGGPVLLASEEGDGTLAPKLRGLPTERVRVLNRDACWPKPSWSALIASATTEAAARGAVLLVIDSMAFWAAFEPERENDAGATQAIMDALDEASRTGLAVLLIHHQRKAPGANHGTGVRGSGALTGAVDVVIEFERLGDDAPHTQRRLVALSRWPMTPEVLVIDRDRQDGTWRVVGEAGDRAESEGFGIRERLLSALPIESPGASEEDLVALLDMDKRKLGTPLRLLVKDGLSERHGAGKRGDPYTYSKGVPKGVPQKDTKQGMDCVSPLQGTQSIPEAVSVSVPRDTKTASAGCVSHPDGLVAACRYCEALGEEVVA